MSGLPSFVRLCIQFDHISASGVSRFNKRPSKELTGFVAYDTGTVTTTDEKEIDIIFVHDVLSLNARKAGVGTLLFKRLVDTIRATEIHLIVRSASLQQADARRFYVSLGMVEVDTTNPPFELPYDPRSDQTYMRVTFDSVRSNIQKIVAKHGLRDDVELETVDGLNAMLNHADVQSMRDAFTAHHTQKNKDGLLIGDGVDVGAVLLSKVVSDMQYLLAHT